MRTQVERQSEEAEKVVRDIRRATRRQYSAEEKVRIVIAGLRGEDSIAALRRYEVRSQRKSTDVPPSTASGDDATCIKSMVLGAWTRIIAWRDSTKTTEALQEVAELSR